MKKNEVKNRAEYYNIRGEFEGKQSTHNFWSSRVCSSDSHQAFSVTKKVVEIVMAIRFVAKK